MVSAHRYAYELMVGPIPAGLTIDHKCRVHNCVQPAHLEPVTCRVNILRGDTGQNNAQKTHCPHGHPYSDDNLIVTLEGWRRCRTCRREADRRRQPRRRGAIIAA